MCTCWVQGKPLCGGSAGAKSGTARDSARESGSSMPGLSMCTPRKVTTKPVRRERVSVTEVVLRPLKRMKEG